MTIDRTVLGINRQLRLPSWPGYFHPCEIAKSQHRSIHNLFQTDVWSVSDRCLYFVDHCTEQVAPPTSDDPPFTGWDVEPCPGPDAAADGVRESSHLVTTSRLAAGLLPKILSISLIKDGVSFDTYCKIYIHVWIITVTVHSWLLKEWMQLSFSLYRYNLICLCAPCIKGV